MQLGEAEWQVIATPGHTPGHLCLWQLLRGGSIVVREGRIYAAAEHAPVAPGSLDVPFPRAWPPV
jgi:uncharacterized protein (AIM24 family)